MNPIKKALRLTILVTILGVFWGFSFSYAEEGALLKRPNSVFVSNDYAYVVSDTDNALEVIDVSDPARPTHKGSIVTGTDGAMLVTPTSVAVSGNYAYVTSKLGNALEIVDISDPTNPTHANVLFHGDNGVDLRRPFAITIFGNYAYIATNGPSVEILDISNPTFPIFAGRHPFNLLTPISSISVSGNYLLATFFCLCNGNGGVYIVDISDPSTPTLKGTFDDGSGTPSAIFVSGDYAYVALRDSEYSLKIFDVSDPTNVVHMGSIYDGDDGANLFDVRSVVVRGDYAYSVSFAGNALEIVNISDLTNPTHKGKFYYEGELSYPNSLFISGDYAYVTLNLENALDIIDISNPANPVRKGILRDGELIGVPPIPARNPVLIVPGIMGSYLNKDDGTEVWMNIPKMLLPGSDSYLNDLSLKNTGELTDINIEATNIIKKTASKDYFDGLMKYLGTRGYSEDVNLYVFPYDWRLDVHTSAISLSNKIEEIVQNTGANKVDVIAHSMGGLVIKDYLKYFGGNLIDTFIDLGTPHTGAPKSFKILMHGDNLNASILSGFLGLNEERVKFITQNMPSVYQLLPSSLYGNYLYDMDDLDNDNNRGLLDYENTKEFLKNTGRNSLLVERADVFHQEIDNLDPADYGVKTYNVVGCGTQTLDKIFVFNKEDNGGTEYIISYINGDGTVPLKSAEALLAQDSYYLKNAVHALMPSTSGVKELISTILLKENLNLGLFPNIATSSDGCTIPNGKIVSFHSPIDLHIYDLDGNHTGPNADGDIENNIDGVSYDIIDGNKFAYLPGGQEYIIQGTATDSGTFNARVQEVENEIIIETKYYNAIPLNLTTKIEVQENEITIDNDNDGFIDQEVFPSAILNETQSADITKPNTLLMADQVGKKDHKFDKPVKITLIAEDDNSGILKTEYSLNNDSWLAYSEPFNISTRGETKILYRSTDRAGNVELPKSAIITINPPGNSWKNQ